MLDIILSIFLFLDVFIAGKSIFIGDYVTFTFAVIGAVTCFMALALRILERKK